MSVQSVPSRPVPSRPVPSHPVRPVDMLYVSTNLWKMVGRPSRTGWWQVTGWCPESAALLTLWSTGSSLLLAKGWRSFRLEQIHPVETAALNNVDCLYYHSYLVQSLSCLMIEELRWDGLELLSQFWHHYCWTKHTLLLERQLQVSHRFWFVWKKTSKSPPVGRIFEAYICTNQTTCGFIENWCSPFL